MEVFEYPKPIIFLASKIIRPGLLWESLLKKAGYNILLTVSHKGWEIACNRFVYFFNMYPP